MLKFLVVTLIVFQSFELALGQTSGLQMNKKYTLKEIDSLLSIRWKDEITRSPDLPNSFISAFPHAPFMFYWDTYFINKGLLKKGYVNIARQNVQNILEVVNKYGYMGNAAITAWGMNRSQPPYLSVMVRDIYNAQHDTSFLHKSYIALKKEYSFWTGGSPASIENHNTTIPGLQHFSHHSSNKELIILFREVAERFDLNKNVSDSLKCIIAAPYAAEAETGMDFTPRFAHRCPDYVAVDLNCLLYCYERDLDWITNILKLQDEPDWLHLAKRRKALFNKYCWDESTGMYYDYNYKTGSRSPVASVVTFQPLWAGLASKRQAKKVVGNIKLFQTSYGLTTTFKNDKDGNKYQWGALSIWAPMQLLAVDGMRNYNYLKAARKISNQYLALVQKNFNNPVSSNSKKTAERKPGLTYEKYKANGTINDDEYTANIMMGWTAGVFNYLYR